MALARIITTGDGHTCDSYIIFDENDAPLRDPHRQQTLTTALLRALADGLDYDRSVHRRVSRQMRHFRIPTGIELTTDARSGLIRMELITSDRPGLLSVIGERLAAHQLNLVTAKIATLGERERAMRALEMLLGDKTKRHPGGHTAQSLKESLVALAKHRY